MPHHRVYHQLQPEKICVAFDCSSEYRGRSINKELLAGTDLTNQIVETMIKFRQDKVAFVADIENMFFIYESLLCFLWWQDGDISRQPVDYEMFVHVFGGTSSPPCCNYALKRTVVDGEDQFGKEAAETL